MTWQTKKVIANVNLIRIDQAGVTEVGGVDLPKLLDFAWEQFVMSVVRTRGLQTQLDRLTLEKRQRLVRYGSLVAEQIDVYIDPSTPQFSFIDELDTLPDDERPSMAGNVGAAIADLVMESLRFHWRCNASELKLSPAAGVGPDKKGKTPDYVYDPGREHICPPGSVVIVEAKGSLSKTEAKEAPVNRRARSAYKEQVEQFIGPTPHGLTVVSGFAIAFGAVPGAGTSRMALASPQTITVGNNLSAAAVSTTRLLVASMPEPMPDPQRDKPAHVSFPKPQFVPVRRGGGGGGDGRDGRREGERAQPSGLVAFASYENVFLICGALNAAAFLRSILSGRPDDVKDDAAFQEFWLLDSPDPVLVGPLFSGPHVFGIYELSAVEILKSAADNRQAPPPVVDLSVAPTRDPSETPGRAFFMQGDGLTYIRRPMPAKHRRWDLIKGDWD
jgi:hypothetical protein